MIKKLFYSLRKGKKGVTVFHFVKDLVAFMRKTFLVFLLKGREKRLDPSENLYVFADPRGGSTWLAQIFLALPKTAMIWEPLHASRGLIPEHLNLCNEPRSRPFIPEDESWPDALKLFDEIFSGKRINGITSSVTPLSYLKNERFVVKFIRGNSMIPWLTKQFEFKHKPVYFLRHPVPVALSQIKTFFSKGEWPPLSVPNQRFPDLWLEHEQFLNSLESKMEKLIAIWCVHNKYTIEHPRSGKDWVVVYYEHLVLNPEEQLGKIFKEINLGIPQNIDQLVRARSRSDRENMSGSDPKDHLVKWSSKVTDDQKKKIQRILDHFEITIYSAYDILPRE